MSASYDAVIVGSGPNGLAAAIKLAQDGASVLVIEAMDSIGGGLRTEELTLPGFKHDVCAAAHPVGILSPFFKQLPLSEHGLEWVLPPASVAHPLDDQPAVILRRSVAQTAAGLGSDERSYSRLVSPFLRDPSGLLEDVLGPIGGAPNHPLVMARFGLTGLSPRHAARPAIPRDPGAGTAGRLRRALDPAARPATDQRGRAAVHAHRAHPAMAHRQRRLGRAR